MSAAAASLATIFSAMGVRATYQPPAGAAVLCRAIPQGMARQVEVGGIAVMVDMAVWHLRRAEFEAAPVPGGTLTVGGSSWSLDLVEPAANDPLSLKWQVRAHWGSVCTYRIVDGAGVTLNPPTVAGLVVAEDVDEGGGSLSLRAGMAVGQFRTGDVLVIGADEYTVAAPVSAASNTFANVAVTPSIGVAIAEGTPVTPRFACDFALKVAEAEYLAHEVTGGVQAGDRRLVVTQNALDAAGVMDEPSTRVQIHYRGRWASVLSARAIGTGADRVAWDLQLR